MAPCSIPSSLAHNPELKPQYSVTIKSKEGEQVTLGDPKATRALIALMNYHAVIGGAACHWGGPSALAEIMSALHGHMFAKSPWYEHYNFVNDAGHTENGIYALRANLGFDNLKFNDLRKFRSIESKLTGHGESHLNPQGVLLSNGPLGSAFPQSQGLALADKLSEKDRTTICVISDGACMEGEAKESFAAIPGLCLKGKMAPYVLIISDNNTKLSGRIDKDSFSMNPTFESLSTLGWDLTLVSEGHNLQEVYTQIETALEKVQKNPLKPVCLWIKTIKGYGVKSTSESASGGHGFPLKKGDGKLESFIQEIYQDKAPEEFVTWAKEISPPPAVSATPSSAPKKEKIQVGISKALNWAAEQKLPVFSVSADLQGSTGLADFHKKFPENFLEVGVAESNMINTAAGLSKMGFIPIVDTFAQFGV
ncbi:MAG: transketolase, partial [Bacteriovoracaceae bacterium]|nr:transketolase [Bacteriovoracaceae bacterium]